MISKEQAVQDILSDYEQAGAKLVEKVGRKHLQEVKARSDRVALKQAMIEACCVRLQKKASEAATSAKQLTFMVRRETEWAEHQDNLLRLLREGGVLL